MPLSSLRATNDLREKCNLPHVGKQGAQFTGMCFRALVFLFIPSLFSADVQQLALPVLGILESAGSDGSGNARRMVFRRSFCFQLCVAFALLVFSCKT